ncbi:7437_t:CDS:2, partial [Cetraspora pellucida]
MPELQKKNALNLFELMQNLKEKHENKIISVYLQKKTLKYIKNNHKNSVVLKTENVNLKSTNWKLSKNNQDLLYKIQSLDNSNWHLRNKVENTWHKEVSQIKTETGIHKALQCSQYGVLVDESIYRKNINEENIALELSKVCTNCKKQS